MCTSLSLPTADGRHLFGRTLDLDTHFGERVILTPAAIPSTLPTATPRSTTTPFWAWPPS